MANDIVNTLRDRMANDADVTNRITTYRSEPAIFTARPIPGGAEYKYIFIGGPTRADENGTKQTRGKTIEYNIQAYGKRDGSNKDVKNLAWDIDDLFHEGEDNLNPTGYNVIRSETEGPIEGPGDSEESMSFIVPIVLLIHET